MPCYYPIEAWRPDPESGSKSMILSYKASLCRSTTADLLLPCGQCIGCRLKRASHWATRNVHEAQMHEHSSFLTLTYNDEFLPMDRGHAVLRYRDFQLFMKRLRRRFGAGVRHFTCGEYGPLNWRPHFHSLVYGVHFDDRQVFKVSPRGDKLYVSKILDSLWIDAKSGKSLGYASIGDVSYESAGYVARYTTKKIYGAAAEQHYARVDCSTGEVFQIPAEDLWMSLKPGIGATWIERYGSEVYPSDEVILRGGRKISPPKYYDKVFAEMSPENAELIEQIKLDRGDRAQFYLDSSTVSNIRTLEQGSRLYVKETVLNARVSQLKRSLE